MACDIRTNTEWKARASNFLQEIGFVYPSRSTAAISVTGHACGLDCLHCGGHYLKGMKGLGWAIENMDNANIKSWLISGGCRSDGRIDYSNCVDDIKKLKVGRRINLHVGLASGIGDLKDVADCVSFDFIGDDETIKQVIGIDRKVQDYIDAFQKLRDEVRVIPHICIGLKGGEISGERRSLEILKELRFDDEIVFIVFIPTRGTAYGGKQPPKIEEVMDVLSTARKMFPQNIISLGCMRPGGRYRSELDSSAVKAGVNRIVQPARSACEKAAQLGLKAVYRKECCVF